MNKKIGILSVYNHNYGSILQAYALQQALEGMGNQTEIIFYKKTNYLKQALRLFYIPLLKATIKMEWKKIYCKLFHKDVYEGVLLGREVAFKEFIEHNIKFSSVYKGRRALVEGSNNYDCFVLGSDQVWNPMNLGGDFYTMTFIPENKKKITYAPSFGVSTIPKNQIKKTSNYLKQIDEISVREEEGKRIVGDLADKEAEVVVDPTMLVDRNFWDNQIGERLIREDYIFCYFISANESYRKFASKLEEKTDLKLICIPHVDEYVKYDEEYADYGPETGVGPLEFVNLIANATYVCTDSFHGSVFSTLYERPFYTFSRYESDGGDSTNSRLYSFLKMVCLENRMYKSNENIGEKDLEAPDFKTAKLKILERREKSLAYLNNALKG